MDHLELQPLTQRSNSSTSAISKASSWTHAQQETPSSSTEQANNKPESESTHACSQYLWLPATLHLPYLTTLLTFSTCLGVVVLFLTSYSARNHGLGNDRSGSAAVLFGWRFSPTLFAVLYSLLTANLLTDIRRTEVFARLSRKGGADASSTILFPSRSWWNDPFDALRRSKNNGNRSWALFLASIVNIIAFLIISPLSAGFLSPAHVDMPNHVHFNRLNTASDIPLQLDSADQMMFNTITGAILNQSTSAWVTTDHFVLPFWPSDFGNTAPLTAAIVMSKTPQQWVGRTTAYKATLDCVDISLKSQRNSTASSLGLVSGNSTELKRLDYNGTAFELASDDGCSIRLFARSQYSTDSLWLTHGAGWWANSAANANQALQNTPSTIIGSVVVNATSGCSGRSYISYNKAWKSVEPFQIKGHICRTDFVEADVSATVILDRKTTVSFNNVEFVKNQKSMDAAKYNLAPIQDSFFNTNWSTKFPVPTSQNGFDAVTASFGGPLQAISAASKYSSSPDLLVGSESLIDDCRKLQQEWLGQMLLLSLRTQPISAMAKIEGQVRITERRIVAVLGIGVTIGVLFLISSILIIAIVCLTRPSTRPLNLQSDPASIAVASSLITDNARTRAAFESADLLSKEAIERQVQGGTYSLQDANLELVAPHSSGTMENNDSPEEALNLTPPDARPFVLRTWMGPLLLISLVALLVAIVALYVISGRGGLHQQALVHEFDFSLADVAVGLAPYSIIPTLLAVGIKLWYGAIEENMRRLQPFLAMTVKPAPVSQSLLAEYVNAPLAWVSFKAAKNSHYMLALVGLGALGTEIFTVGISALWDRESSVNVHNLVTGRQMMIRTVPAVYETATAGAGTHQDPVKPLVLSKVYGTYLTSWLYGATNEMAQNASTPAWSKDEWSFAPVDFEHSAKEILALSSNATSSDLRLLPYNITVSTPALRARLECKVIDYINDTSLWLSEWDFNNKTLDATTKKTMWNATNRPPKLDVGYELLPQLSNPPKQLPRMSIPVTNALAYVSCCSNVTGDIPGEAAIGYWTPLLAGYVTSGFVSKWIVGHPLDGLYRDSSYTDGRGPSIAIGKHWIWKDKPKMQAISCTPVLEQANASATVDLSTGMVLNYTIQDRPINATGAWSDNYLLRKRSPDYTGPNTTLYGPNNITVSYGYVFLDALLNAANIRKLGYEFQSSIEIQNEEDHAFNFRIRGLNADFMSYSMLSLVNNDKYALLNATTLMEKANIAFGVFFKHYASGNVTKTGGSFAFQPIGAALPSTLGAPSSFNTGGRYYNNSQTVDLDRTVPIFVHVPIDTLVMSPIAVFICLAVLAFLAVTTVVIFAFYSNRFKQLPRDVDTLASVLGFVHGSERLLEWAREKKESGNWNDNGIGGQLMARLGHFENADGVKRWGVEIVEEGEIGSR
ncbi:hypothetical protein E6O75_ATG11306 [Venturia nashicola]|uniref:Uncharacterized protein n=1 Tax=Venturia nashicola TaxID=86259 RepID=A0A4Z1NRZ2_9PEZI|nr:hypothetical protein E6O75_ATG11306 [Venturia nashicola]